MALNLGYIEGTCQNGDVVVRIYYDATQPAGPTQPLINGPRGYCLDVTNKSGRKASLTVENKSGRKASLTVEGVTAAPFTVTIAKGDLVTTGPAAGRSRTLAQMQALGFTTRGSVGNFAISCD